MRTLLLFLLVGQVSIVQPLFKIRPILGVKADAEHFGHVFEPVSNFYYEFKKIPLSTKPFPLTPMGITLEYDFNEKTSLQVGVIGNEDARSAYKIGFIGKVIGGQSKYKELYGSYAADQFSLPSYSNVKGTEFYKQAYIDNVKMLEGEQKQQILERDKR